jgi:hypothetical protein
MINTKHKIYNFKVSWIQHVNNNINSLATFSFSVKCYMFFIHFLFLYYSRCISKEKYCKCDNCLLKANLDSPKS